MRALSDVQNISIFPQATVMDINYENKTIFVHYNGWPPRWDEWIAFSSDRVTLFRTRTANTTISQGMIA
jgi:hypothetical protein